MHNAVYKDLRIALLGYGSATKTLLGSIKTRVADPKFGSGRIRTFLVGSGSGSGKFSPDPDPYLDPDPIGTLAM